MTADEGGRAAAGEHFDNPALIAALRTLKTPALQAAFEAAGNEAAISDSPQAFAAFVRSENRKWAEIVKLAGVTAS